MYTITNFDKLLEVGREGEKAVSELLERSGCEVQDVSKEKWHQANDIDFIVRYGIDFIVRQSEKRSVPNITMEVKTDRRIHETMNICVELESNSNPAMKKEGWFKTSKADWFAFYSPAVETTFFIKREELVALYTQNKYKLKHIYREQVECGKYIKTGLICIIPLQMVKDFCPSTRLISNDATENFDFLFVKS